MPMWYLILRRDVQPREEWTVTLDEHLAWLKRQHEDGTILFSGPTPDIEGPDGPKAAGEVSGGIYVVRASSREQAEQIAGDDPFTRAGQCAFDLLEWQVKHVLGIGAFSATELQALRAAAAARGT